MRKDVSTSETVRLRPKNQLTVPEATLKLVGAEIGDRFVITVEDGGIRLQPVLRSYAGALSGVFDADWADGLRKDRDNWPR